MTNDFLKINFNRLKSIKSEMDEVNEAYRAIREQLQSLRIRYENLERFLAVEVQQLGNEEVEREFKNIIGEDLYIESPTQHTQTFVKSEFLIELLYKENLAGKGTTPKELFDLAQQTEQGLTISLEYTNSVLGKFKKKGLLEQQNKRYYLTNKGREYLMQSSS